ncbi:cytidine deaminase family protein [Promicromonospora sp. NPDC059942]|uniref:cytidine deaminase family protein n=1 Tax=Promicromonospora sp. NPDC059942 TaxID=3347009 RepID=UPI003646F903
MTTATDPLLTAAERRLIDAALEVVARLPEDGAYLHTVASAVMDVHGDVHTGANVGHFTGGPCAELVALGTAAAAGSGPIALIVAVGDEGRGVMPPCGRCRQVLLDQQPDCRVIVPGDDRPYSVPARDLLRTRPGTRTPTRRACCGSARSTGRAWSTAARPPPRGSTIRPSQGRSR